MPSELYVPPPRPAPRPSLTGPWATTSRRPGWPGARGPWAAPASRICSLPGVGSEVRIRGADAGPASAARTWPGRRRQPYTRLSPKDGRRPARRPCGREYWPRGCMWGAEYAPRTVRVAWNSRPHGCRAGNTGRTDACRERSMPGAYSAAETSISVERSGRRRVRGRPPVCLGVSGWPRHAATPPRGVRGGMAATASVGP